MSTHVRQLNNLRFLKEAQAVNGFHREIADDHDFGPCSISFCRGALFLADDQHFFRSVSSQCTTVSFFIFICKRHFVADVQSTHTIFACSARDKLGLALAVTKIPWKLGRYRFFLSQTVLTFLEDEKAFSVVSDNALDICSNGDFGYLDG